MNDAFSIKIVIYLYNDCLSDINWHSRKLFRYSTKICNCIIVIVTCRRDAPLRTYQKPFRKADAPFILSPWGRAILPDNRGDKFHQDTLYTSHVCMKPAAYRLKNNQSTSELIGRASWTIVHAILLGSPIENQPG